MTVDCKGRILVFRGTHLPPPTQRASRANHILTVLANNCSPHWRLITQKSFFKSSTPIGPTQSISFRELLTMLSTIDEREIPLDTEVTIPWELRVHYKGRRASDITSVRVEDQHKVYSHQCKLLLDDLNRLGVQAPYGPSSAFNIDVDFVWGSAMAKCRLRGKFSEIFVSSLLYNCLFRSSVIHSGVSLLQQLFEARCIQSQGNSTGSQF